MASLGTLHGYYHNRNGENLYLCDTELTAVPFIDCRAPKSILGVEKHTEMTFLRVVPSPPCVTLSCSLEMKNEGDVNVKSMQENSECCLGIGLVSPADLQGLC